MFSLTYLSLEPESAMKPFSCVATLALLLTITLSQTPLSAATRATTDPYKEHDHTDEIVINHFLGALSSFSKIVADPENSQNVGVQATNIFAHCFTAFIESVRRGELRLDATEEEVRTYTNRIIRNMLKNRSITQFTSSNKENAAVAQ